MSVLIFPPALRTGIYRTTLQLASTQLCSRYITTNNKLKMFKPVFGRSKKSTDNGSKAANSLGPVISTSYKSHEVDIPDDFLGPLADPSELEIEKIDFEKTTLPEYKDYYAIVIDNLMSREECETLIHMTEMSAGAHQEGVEVENNGWQPAMVNAGVGYEFMATDYRNSDRIIWDHHVLAQRLWERIMQGEGMKEYFSCLDGEKYAPVRGVYKSGTDGQSLVITKQGLNERLRFLKYGAGQFFKGMLSSLIFRSKIGY